MFRVMNLGKTVKTTLILMCAALFGSAWTETPALAATDGNASFTVTLVTIPGNYSQRVDAYWLADASGNFIMTLREDSATRANYLSQWNTAKAGDTYVDGFSGATISTWGTFSVTWDGHDKNNVLLPDGTYKFWVEMTDYNGQGPYTTNGIAFVKGSAGVTNTYPNAGAYITGMSVAYVPLHDVAVSAITPNVALANTNITVGVLVTNLTGSTESVSVVLSNLTSGTLIGTQVLSLAGLAATNIAFPWTTPALGGDYSLRATAGPVAGENSTANNALTHVVTVQFTPHDISVVQIKPSLVQINTNVTVMVVVMNETATAESFSVVLSNLTTSTLIGSQMVSGLAGNAGVSVSFPWSTVGLSGDYLLQATAGPVQDEPSNALADNTVSQSVAVRVLVPDVAISGVTAPALVPPNNAAGLTVQAANLGEKPSSFNVQLWDETEGRFIGPMWQVPNLPVSASVALPLTFTTTNSSLGYHTLRAVASPVSGELLLPNNTNRVTVIVADGWVTNTFIAKGATWLYNDLGVDLTATPWRATNYYDATWSDGAAPLGYSQDGLLTNIATVIGYGPAATKKYSTAYFRQAFNVDWLPVSLTVNVRCVDGVVLYLNGAELARFNMPTGAVAYVTAAAGPVTGPAAYTYLSADVSPAGLVPGQNVLAAEIHKSGVAAPGLVLDVELTGATPLIPANHQVDAVALTIPDSVLAGDRMVVTVTVANRGNVNETVLVLLVNQTTGQVVGSQTLPGLPPGGSTSVDVEWGTLGAAAGSNQLVAYTVAGGVTNLAGAFTNIAMVSDAVFNPVGTGPAGAIGGRCSALAANGNLILVGAGASLEAWDRSNPAAPVKLGAVRLPGLIQGLAVGNGWAYAACGSAGVQFVDLSNPAQPVHQKIMQTSGQAYGVAISGNYLCVADGAAGVRIADISNPAAPVLAGVYYTVGPARAIATAGSIAYVLDNYEGLLLLNLSNPAAPSLAGSYAAFDSGQALAVSGSYAYIVDDNNHFYVVNISNPASPSLAGSLLLANKVGQALLADGNTVHIAAGVDGLLTVDVSSPASPTLISSISTSGEASGVALAGSKLYAADGFAGFQVYDVATPAAPVLQADFPIGLRAADVAVADSLAYVAAGEAGLRIFSLTNPSTPQLLSRFAGVTNPRAVAVSGPTAYVGDGQYGLKIVDVANPLSPTLLGSYANPNLGSIRNVAVSGSSVVVSDGRTVLLLNVSAPASPSLIGSYSYTNFAFSLCVANSKAYLACGSSGVSILGISGGGLTPLGSYSGAAPSLATDIAVSGTTAYVAYSGVGWAILDVSNPASPVLVNASTSQGPVSALAAAGSLVTLFTASNSAVTMDASTPLTPVQKSAFGSLVGALRLAATPSLVLTAEDEAGVAVLRTAAPNVILLAHATPDNSILSVSWNSIAGQTYTVYRSTDLNAGFTVFQDNVAATPPVNTITNSMANGAAFYIIAVH